MIDVGPLLREARERAGVNQRVLAARAGTSRSVITEYESCARSPTVRQLDRLLAACGVQARVVLEPLGADLDAQVDAMLAGTRPGASAADSVVLHDLRRSLDDDPEALRATFTPWQPTGKVSWAFDGATALQVHGFAVPTDDVGLVVVLDEAAREWLTRLGVKGSGRYAYTNWRDEEPAQLEAVFAWPVLTILGFLRIRTCEGLPATVMVVTEPGEPPFPVVPVDEVERVHPAFRDVLERWRERRTVVP